VTGVVPYLKLGIIDGVDLFGNNPNTGALSYRWGFEVGAGAPASFRVGVITDGLDHPTDFTPSEVHLQHVDADDPGSPVIISSADTGLIPIGNAAVGEDYIPGRNRFVDMHFFDITDAEPGDQFAFAVHGELGGFRSAGIAGFSFDIVDPTVENLPGDHNLDGSVDAADYVWWRKSDGLPDGYAAWQEHFGESLGGGSSSGLPEPSAGLMLVIGSIVFVAVHRLRRSGVV
jgi:hypothetical protein